MAITKEQKDQLAQIFQPMVGDIDINELQRRTAILNDLRTQIELGAELTPELIQASQIIVDAKP